MQYKMPGLFYQKQNMVDEIDVQFNIVYEKK